MGPIAEVLVPKPIGDRFCHAVREKGCLSHHESPWVNGRSVCDCGKSARVVSLSVDEFLNTELFLRQVADGF